MAEPARNAALAAASGRERILVALRRRSGRATAGDLAADTGVALDRVESDLRELVHVYESHLDVDEQGRLLYRFAPDLLERLRPESPEERRARRRLRRARLVRNGLRGLALVGVAAYGWVYGAVAIVALASMGMLGGRIWLTDAVVAHRNRFRKARGLPLVRSPVASPWDPPERATPVAEPILPRLKAATERVMRFVVGPSRRADDLLTRERTVVSWLRANRGVVVPAEVVRLLGGSLEVADRLLTGLLVRHRGDVEVDDAGTLSYRFDALLATADDAATVPAGGGPPPVWEQPSPDDDRLFRDRADLWVPAMGVVNVVTAIALHVWLLPRLGWEFPWLEALVVWFPIGWTAVLAVAVVARTVVARGRRTARALEWARLGLLRVILGEDEGEGGRSLPIGAPAALRRLIAPPVPPDAVIAAALAEVVRDLGGEVAEVDHTARGDLEADLLARFPRVRAELEAVARTREMLGSGHGRMGRIVWSTRDDSPAPSAD